MRYLSYILLLLLIPAWGCTGKRSAIGGSASIEKKYSAVLKVDEAKIENRKLYAFIDAWYGTPYRYGGKSKSGVDCSGFTTILLKDIYGKELSGSSAGLYDQSKKISRNQLEEGDLVFFRIETKGVSHVGVYLQNNRFVHATTKAGVMIDDLGSEYYRKYFEGAGRVR